MRKNVAPRGNRGKSTDVPDGEWDFRISQYKLLASIRDPKLELSRQIMLRSDSSWLTKRELAALAKWYQRLADLLHERADIREDQERYPKAASDRPTDFYVEDLLQSLARDLADVERRLAQAVNVHRKLSENARIHSEIWIVVLPPLGAPALLVREQASKMRRQARHMRAALEQLREEREKGGAPPNNAMEEIVEWALDRGITATQVQRRCKQAGVHLTRDAIQAAMRRKRARAASVKTS